MNSMSDVQSESEHWLTESTVAKRRCPKDDALSSEQCGFEITKVSSTTIDKGAIINVGAGNGALQFVDHSGRSVPGYHSIDVTQGHNVLFEFLRWISATIRG